MSYIIQVPRPVYDEVMATFEMLCGTDFEVTTEALKKINTAVDKLRKCNTLPQ